MLDWYTPLIMVVGFIIFMLTWVALWFVGVVLRGGRDSTSLALSSLVLTGMLYVTIGLAIIGIPWWLLGIYIFFLVITVFLYLGSIYEPSNNNNNKQ